MEVSTDDTELKVALIKGVSLLAFSSPFLQFGQIVWNARDSSNAKGFSGYISNPNFDTPNPTTTGTGTTAGYHQPPSTLLNAIPFGTVAPQTFQCDGFSSGATVSVYADNQPVTARFPFGNFTANNAGVVFVALDLSQRPKGNYVLYFIEYAGRAGISGAIYFQIV